MVVEKYCHEVQYGSAPGVKPLFGITQVGGMRGAGPVADLGRVLFEPLAEDVAVVDDLNRVFVPNGWLQESNRCLAELKLEARGAPDMFQT
ncbi:MAG: hypothetical protein ACKPKO_35865, partial [Candidatus Fonsibacter sp.]